MSTSRNTKGQFARKTAPKKPVKKPTQLDRIERLLKATFDAQMIVAERMNGQREQIQRDVDQIRREIEQVRTLAYQTLTRSRANTVILNKTLAGVDLLKSGSSFMQEVEQHRAATPAQPEEQGLEGGDYCNASPELLADLWKMGFEKDLGRFRPFVNWHAKQSMMILHDVITCEYGPRSLRQLPGADFLSRARVTAKKLGLVPEEPKAEPWKPKVNEWVVCDKVQEGPSPGWAKPFMDDLIGIPMKVVERERAYAVRACSFLWADEWLRPATPEEIAEAEKSEKLKKLVRGCRVETPDGEGTYLGCSQYDDAYHIVLLDTTGPHNCNRYTLDQLTPLT